MRPTHAYVPGRTPRHPEGAFDAVRQSARPGMDAAALAASGAMRHGLLYLEEGLFWEAHEVLEPVWLALPDGPDRRFVRGLIQLANGLLKMRMDRPRAALRLAAIARDLLKGPGAEAMGLDETPFLARADALRQAAEDAL